jgi:ATP-dependent DNA ligase
MEIHDFTYFYPERAGLVLIDQPLISRLSDDPAWIAEPKKNGKRLELHRLPSGNWEFWNRHGEKMSYTPGPELAAALADFPLEARKYYLFDGELCHGKVKGIRHRIMLYDVFIMADHLLIGVPFKERRQILATLENYGGFHECLEIAPQYPDNFRAVFDELITDPEIEGLVFKNLGGKLNLGRKRAANSAWMLKVRRPSNSYRH